MNRRRAVSPPSPGQGLRPLVLAPNTICGTPERCHHRWRLPTKYPIFQKKNRPLRPTPRVVKYRPYLSPLWPASSEQRARAERSDHRAARRAAPGARAMPSRMPSASALRSASASRTPVAASPRPTTWWRTPATFTECGEKCAARSAGQQARSAITSYKLKPTTRSQTSSPGPRSSHVAMPVPHRPTEPARPRPRLKSTQVPRRGRR